MTAKFLTICLLTAFSGALVHADPRAVVVNSDTADYDGTQITLKGSVVVDHPIGILSATDVVMKPTAGCDGEFSWVELTDDVFLKLAEGGELSCSKAFVDITASSAVCSGHEQKDHVVYTESVIGKNKEKVPVVLKCRKLSLQFESPPTGHTPAAARDKVRVIAAEDDVTISYNHDFIASGDKAIYHRLPGDASVLFPGTIALTGGEGAGSCLVTNRCGDMVYANAIEIDTCNHCLSLDNPKGLIRCEGPQGVLRIHADEAKWHENEGVIVLTGHVEVIDPAMGFLKSHDEVRLISKGQQCKEWVRAESTGESTLVYKTQDTPFAKTIKCFGQCILDHEKMQAVLTSPKDAEGAALPDRQVFYMDEKGEIFADRVVVDYKVVGAETRPDRITMTGHVKILNGVPDPTGQCVRPRQYILADNVEFFPETQQMVLTATKGRRVLFYDEENEFEMSAQGVKTVRDNTTKKDAVQGTGDVRFHLIDQEIDKLRQQFSLEKIAHKILKK